MVSIIICSRESSINLNLQENIKNTIGAIYELIIIDNSENKYTIAEAYNLGIEKSKGNYLCFIHDDIFFRNTNWGNAIVNLFKENKTLGLIGVAGSKIKSITPSGWWTCEESFKVMHIIQHQLNKEITTIKKGFKNSIIEEVAVVDGVFLAIRKEDKLTFNKSSKGFHNYDLELAFQTKLKGLKVGVTSQVLLEHFSIGNLNTSWLNSTIEVHEKYKNILPLYVGNIEKNAIEIYAGKQFINHYFKIGTKYILIKFWMFLLNRKLALKVYYYLFVYMFKRKLKWN